MSFIYYFICAYLYYCTFTEGVSANDVLGCGGYVQSEVEIDFSQVKIKLLTQQGNLKYETECAPNNGYYFIRLYDKGEYILKVSPPEGWSFEPEKVNLKVDGEKDPCSLSKDINFLFKGFAVVGRVVTIGSDVGPPGISVDLKQGEKTVLHTLTSENGDYLFTPLAAGTYDVIASHSTWTLVKNKVTVTVSDKNGNAGSSLVVGGYFLTGSIDVSGKIAEKIRFVLHSSKKFVHKLGCQKDPLPNYQNKLKLPVLCHVTPNSKGIYEFSNIPPGKYTVVPHVTSFDIVYDVDPAVLDVEIRHEDNHIQEPFKIKGRSIHGRVLMGKNSPGIQAAQVTLDGDIQTVTDEKGQFVFHNVKFGNILIQVKAEGVEFDDWRTTLNINTPTTSSIFPVRYQTCFSVSVDSASDLNIPWFISIIGTNSQHETQTGSSGSGCIFLEPGEYRASISLTAQDEEAGIRFGPREHVFTVESQPIKNLAFSQFLGEIHGSINCLESCRALTVSLRPSKGGSGSPRTTTTSNQGKFIFTEVVPGEYLMSVDKEEWCWRDQTIPVAVNAKVVPATFEQTGFRLTLNASHRVTISYVTNHGHTGTLHVVEGTSRQCVAAPGKYAFTPTGCHKFGNAPLAWDTASPQLLSLIASHHQATGSLLSSEAGPFTINVKSEGNPDYVIGPLHHSPKDKNIYIFETFMESGETLTLTPSSSSNLFQYNPPSFTFQMENDCMVNVVEFEAERALFLKGFVKPDLKGVTIKVAREGEELTFTTNSEGFFIAGPLDKSHDYTVTAEKVGYVVKPPSQRVEMKLQKSSEVIKMSFEAYKLAEIIVRISDEEGRPLEGVLVSTSGGKNYRQNSLTESDGTFAFQSLMPSDYFLRPMMKEYNFDPPSKMVKVEVGATVNVSISGVRVAYSIFGQTLSLSGEPEGEVVIEAVGVGALELQEEALSDAQGNFRIRGLMPKGEYKIQLKRGDNVNQHVERSLPKEKEVRIESSDFKGVKVVVIRPFLQMDVAVMVNTERQYLPSLTAEIYRDDSQDSSPAHVVTMVQHPFFMLPPMIMDFQSYSVHLVSSLPHTQYSYASPSVSFVANSSFISLSMAFKPTLKSVDAEISRGTVLGLLLFILMVSVVLNYNKIQPLALKAVDMYCNRVNSKGNGGKVTRAAQQSQMPVDSAFIEPVMVRKRVKVRKT